MDKKPTPPKLPPRPGAPSQSAHQLPPLPSLDRSAPPVVQQQPVLTGPQRLESAEQKLSIQRSMSNDGILVKFTQQFLCAVHGCLNYTNCGTISFDMTFQMYRISIVCSSCITKPRP